MKSDGRKEKSAGVLTRIALCLVVLIFGAAAMVALSKLKKPPAEATLAERPLRVAVLKATAEDIPVDITGFGEARALDTLPVAPEISGKIVAIHPLLEIGERIEKGALLFAIDPTNYAAARDEAAAMVRMWENSVRRLSKQQTLDTTRLAALLRNRALAKSEFLRVQKLFVKDRVGTRSGVDAAEQAANSKSDIYDKMAQTVALYPLQIGEAESSLAAARARAALAQKNFERCRVVAPFHGRIKDVSLEAGQYVTPGQNVLTLANDAILELLVPIDSRDAKQWLRFDARGDDLASAWFPSVAPAACTVRWTEGDGGDSWRGTLHRVVKFEQQTRTLTLAIRVSAEEAVGGSTAALPLVEGMFCSVTIAGRKMKGVIPLPRWAVSFKGTVYMAENGRLTTRAVTVARTAGEKAYISGGIAEGEHVIITRLIDPLENAKVVTAEAPPEGA